MENAQELVKPPSTAAADLETNPSPGEINQRETIEGADSAVNESLAESAPRTDVDAPESTTVVEPSAIDQLGLAIHTEAVSEDETQATTERYYLAKTVERNGDHAIHTSKCPYFPTKEDRIYLGSFSSGTAAAIAARNHYAQISGCHYCSREEHSKNAGFGRKMWWKMTGKSAVKRAG